MRLNDVNLTREDIQEKYYYKDGKLFYKKNGNEAGYTPKLPHKQYVRVYIRGYYIMAHRLIWILHNGSIPAGMQIDHINGIKYDNRLDNLRLATNSQNRRNIKQTRAKSGFRGVGYKYRSNRKRHWYTRMQVDGKTRLFGYFLTKKEAIQARLDAEKKYYPEWYPREQ